MPGLIRTLLAVCLVTCTTSTASPSPTPATAAPATLAPPAASAAAVVTAAPTPCPGLAVTPETTEGPFFKAGSPERPDLTAGLNGTRLLLQGSVRTRSCAPLARAKVDLWQADAQGNYDNTGYRLRGHVLTDASGRYSFMTIEPAEYPGRTPHLHVKVTPAGGRTLTTQLYLPGAAGNDRDSLFRRELVVTRQPGSPLTTVSTFDFVLDLP